LLTIGRPPIGIPKKRLSASRPDCGFRGLATRGYLCCSPQS
jgi:hypothetical protein